MIETIITLAIGFYIGMFALAICVIAKRGQGGGRVSETTLKPVTHDGLRYLIPEDEAAYFYRLSHDIRVAGEGSGEWYDLTNELTEAFGDRLVEPDND